MGMTYNKKYISKDRRVVTSGPRDNQLKQKILKQSQAQVDNSLVTELKIQIENLQNKLAVSGKEGYTSEQVNDIVQKTVIEEITKIKKEYENEKSILIKKMSSLEEDILELKIRHKKEIQSLNELINNKDVVISQLKNNPQQIDNKLTSLLTEATKKIEEMSNKINNYENNTPNDVISEDNDRPQMETVFVDPIEKESSIEKHLDIEDISVHKKEQMHSKVNKLKSLLGSLPTKK